MLGSALGLRPWLPSDWPERFGSGSVPTGDAAVYALKKEPLGARRDAHGRITEAVGRLDVRRLDGVFPDAAHLDVFPTIRHALTQVLVAHTAYHVGQLGAWRRAMGLPPIARSFE